MNYIEQARDKLRKRLVEVGLEDIDSTLLDLYTLVLLTCGTKTVNADVHDAWAIWRTQTNSTHKSILPFYRLSEDVQRLDKPYRDTIVQAAHDLVESQ